MSVFVVTEKGNAWFAVAEMVVISRLSAGDT